MMKKRVGWANQSKRHSNAKKYGHAGGKYATPKKRFKTTLDVKPVKKNELEGYIANNQSKLILQGIALSKEAQKLHNEGKYSEARKIKIASNKILDGFNEDIVTSHFALFEKNKVVKPKRVVKPVKELSDREKAIGSIENELDKSGGIIFQGVVADILEENNVYKKKDIDAVINNIDVPVSKSFIYDQMKNRKAQKKDAKPVTQKKVTKVKSLVEAIAIKQAIDNLNKKLGSRKRGKIKRTKDLKFEVYE